MPESRTRVIPLFHRRFRVINSVQIPKTIRLKSKTSTIKKGISVMSVEAELTALPIPALHPLISLFHRIWPVAGLGFAVIVTAARSGFLGYELFRLVS